MEPMYIDKSSRQYYSFPVHQHDCWEITINLQGSGTATINGLSYPFQPGTIFCLAPGIRHGKVSQDGFIDGSLMLRDFVPFSSSDIYHFEDDANATVQHLFGLMFEIMIKDGPNAQAIIHSLADAIYQLMISWSQTANRNPVVERFQKLLLENLSNPDFDLASVRKTSGYSSSYFRKLFKRITGHTPLGYITHMRIEYARRQIQQYFGVRSMKEIALNSGFSDPYYFSRIFRQVTGLSPMKYGATLSKVKVQKIDYIPPPNFVA